MIFSPTNNAGGRQISATIVRLIGQIYGWQIMSILVDWNGLEGIRMNWNGSEWIGMDRNGSEWIGMDRNGLEWHLIKFESRLCFQTS